MINTIYYFMVIKMNPEAQFYLSISTGFLGNEDPTVVRYIVFLSFHEQSSTPPPLSSIWDIHFNL
jgi:hypothetical protein